MKIPISNNLVNGYFLFKNPLKWTLKKWHITSYAHLNIIEKMYILLEIFFLKYFLKNI